MNTNIPIKINPKQPKPKHGLRIFLIILIVILAILNLGLGFLWWKGKIFLNDFIESAKKAAYSNRWGASADVVLPTVDVKGEEIPGMTRLAGSVRILYQKVDGQILAQYQTTEQLAVVLDYFKSQLAKNNWILVQTDDQKIIFSKDKQQITISADQKDNITTYRITLTSSL